MTPWPVKLGGVAVIVTAVALMVSPSPTTALNLIIMWAIILWLNKRWEDKHEGR